jgi:hypothetical protein
MDSQSAMQMIAERLTQTGDAATKAWSDYRDRFEDVDKALASALDQIKSASGEHATHLNEQVGRIDNALAGAVDKLSAALEPLAAPRWVALRRDVLEMFPDADIDAAFAVLRRWLVRATVREFFSVVAKTVQRRDQWKERTDFWLAYLDEGLITDAWFAFGSQAERLASKFLEDQTMAYATLEGGGATSAQSALIFSIGEIRIRAALRKLLKP